MNTKTFAQQSRNLLMDGVAKKLLYWGFNTKGIVLESPQKVSGGYSFRGEVYDDPNLPQLWESLKKAVQNKGIDVVVEEAAYTWFNRMMALRIMVKNGYEQAQLENAEGLEHTPIILQKARQGQYNFLSKEEQVRLKKIIGDYSKDQEAFALLLVGYCHSNKMLNRVFGKIDDYTELLLPDNMLQQSGFLHLLNTTDAISDAEYKEVELIGWLYQFYISEKKDDVFASFKKGKKAEAKDIPAATQIFTPNWIVKYMVQNTVGKIWLDKKPNSAVKATMKYLVQNESDNTVSSSAQRIENKPIINEITDLTLIDPAVGSGHILVEGFDLLYQMYMEEYYTPEEAVESILKNNLYGLDIDERAAQLATFAILLKAAKHYRDVFAKGWLPNVYAMPEAADFSIQEIQDFLGAEGKEFVEELDAALQLMKQAKNLGSVMKLKLSEDARLFIEKRFKEFEVTGYRDFNLEAIYQNLKCYIPILLLLSKKYTSVIANPPYMGRANMNGTLKQYIDDYFPYSNSDLCTVFIEVLPRLTKNNGKYGFIVPPSWMFLTSFEKLRMHVINNKKIDSLLQLSRGVFGADFGSMTSVISNSKPNKSSTATYLRLVERTFQEFYQGDLQKLFLVANGNIDFKYKFSNYSKEFPNIEHNEKGAQVYYPNIPQHHFHEIPKVPIAYWVSKKIRQLFELGILSDFSPVRKGIDTGKNDKFLRYWYEVSNNKFSHLNGEKKWFIYIKGGGFRKWYGNVNIVVNWENDGKEIKDYPTSTIRNKSYQKKEAITWTLLSSNGFGARYVPSNCVFDNNGSSVYPEKNIDLILGSLNSVFSKNILEILNPTLAFQVGDIARIPMKMEFDFSQGVLVSANINLSKKDWNSRETSWDFGKSPLLNESNSIKQAYNTWQKDVTKEFFQLHTNEEELNRIFIDIYGLKEELNPTVELKDITILQEELSPRNQKKKKGQSEEQVNKTWIKIEEVFRSDSKQDIQLPFLKDIIIGQFISYAIGLFMGRYRLDKMGLNIADPKPTAEELLSYTYNNGKVTIDEDAIIPLMGLKCNFPDDAFQQFNQLLDTIWGANTRTENINFIQECLNKDLEKYLVNDFYKHHCGIYEKKPIYWLFASPKGAFQVLVYMHRMNAFTVEKIRANYLLAHLKNLRSEENLLMANESNLNTQEAKRLDQLRKDITECETYDMELKNVADQQIVFDLDDGVTENYKLFETVVAKIK